jgi:hypothetical protein
MYFEGIADAALAVSEFYYANKDDLPDHVEAKFAELVGQTRSPVDAVVKAAEIIYANRASLDVIALELGAGLASLAAAQGFHGLDMDARGDRMALVLRGQTVKGDAPEAKAEYATPQQAQPA